mmetsp:Transcript_24158/g.41279  ORF Transcript_24158/g.41279 Transcript_24158/m.41279 type:complete len:275 (+) Transcript_24158:135-959(+)
MGHAAWPRRAPCGPLSLRQAVRRRRHLSGHQDRANPAAQGRLPASLGRQAYVVRHVHHSDARWPRSGPHLSRHPRLTASQPTPSRSHPPGCRARSRDSIWASRVHARHCRPDGLLARAVRRRVEAWTERERQLQTHLAGGKVLAVVAELGDWRRVQRPVLPRCWTRRQVQPVLQPVRPVGVERAGHSHARSGLPMGGVLGGARKGLRRGSEGPRASGNRLEVGLSSRVRSLTPEAARKDKWSAAWPVGGPSRPVGGGSPPEPVRSRHLLFVNCA